MDLKKFNFIKEISPISADITILPTIHTIISKNLAGNFLKRKRTLVEELNLNEERAHGKSISRLSNESNDQLVRL